MLSLGAKWECVRVYVCVLARRIDAWIVSVHPPWAFLLLGEGWGTLVCL